MNRAKLTTALVCALVMAGCSDESDDAATAGEASVAQPVAKMTSDASSLLDYVPAQTPYVFAMMEALPDAITNRFWNDDVLAPSRRIMGDMVAKGEWKDTAESRLAKAALEALAARMTVAGLNELGYNPAQPMAMYGVGLLPVIRTPVAVSGGLEAFVADVESRSGETVPAGTLDGLSYRYFDAGEARFFGAEQDGMVVLGVLPAGAGDADLKSALGLVPPANSLADSKQLSQMIERHDFMSNFGGFIDTVKLVDAFMTPDSADNAALFALMDYDPNEISDTCRSEAREMALVAPSMVAGYTRADEQALGVAGVIELREDLAQGLANVTAGVPGLGGPGKGIFSFGMGFQLLAMKQFIQERVTSIEADPYECEWFAEMNSSVGQLAQSVNQPIPPFASTLKGFMAVVDDFQAPAGGQMPENVSGRVLLAMDNPQILLGMGQMMLPELAQLQLSADGEPVPLTLSMVPPGLENPQVAMTDEAIAVSVGADQAPLLKAMLGTDASDSGPLMSFGYDLHRFGDIMKDAMGQATAQDDLSDSEMEAAAESFDMLKTLGKRIDIDLRFTDEGARIEELISF